MAVEGRRTKKGFGSWGQVNDDNFGHIDGKGLLTQSDRNRPSSVYSPHFGPMKMSSTGEIGRWRTRSKLTHLLLLCGWCWCPTPLIARASQKERVQTTNDAAGAKEKFKTATPSSSLWAESGPDGDGGGAVPRVEGWVLKDKVLVRSTRPLLLIKHFGNFVLLLLLLQTGDYYYYYEDCKWMFCRARKKEGHCLYVSSILLSLIVLLISFLIHNFNYPNFSHLPLPHRRPQSPRPAHCWLEERVLCTRRRQRDAEVITLNSTTNGMRSFFTTLGARLANLICQTI